MKEYDIYISYDKADNMPLQGSDKGWVSYIQMFLELILEQILNKKPSFLFFPNQENPSAIHIENVQILICIISPSFINSKNCIEDVDIFLSAQESITESQGAIFKLTKSPVSPSQEPSYFQGIRNYELFKGQLETVEVKAVSDFFTPEFEKMFWMKLIDLAYDIANELTSKKGNIYNIGLIKKKLKHNVYLGQTGYDFTNERNYIKRELQKHGYQVLPNQPFPSNMRELEVFVRKNMEKSILSVHLVGNNYGELSQNEEVSIAELESKIAEEHGKHVHAENAFNNKTKSFKQIVWISPEIRKIDERQKSFIENLIQEAETLEGVEILQTPIEDLKSIIKKEILAQSVKKSITINKSNKGKLYLVFDKIDSEEGILMAKYLEEQGLDVLVPAFEGQLMDIRQRHIENLKVCDAAIIHYGKVNEQWVRMKSLDLMKSEGFGRNKPLQAKAIFAAPGSSVSTDFYKDFDIEIFASESSLYPDSFHSFLAKLDKTFYE